jgi:protein SCO1/2
VLALLAALVLGGCSRPSSPRPAAAATDARGEFSVYDVGGAWRDQTGAVAPLESLRGTPTVVALMYTHCTSSCPIALATMRRIAAATSGVRFVLVSLDPQRDTPGALAMYAREHELSPDRWTLLNGKDADVRALAAVLGLRYRRTSGDDVAHANALTLLDATGAIVRQQQGFDGTDQTIRAANELTVRAEIAHR